MNPAKGITRSGHIEEKHQDSNTARLDELPLPSNRPSKTIKKAKNTPTERMKKIKKIDKNKRMKRKRKSKTNREYKR